MDTWLLVCFSYCFCSLCEFCVVMALVRESTKVKKDKKNAKCYFNMAMIIEKWCKFLLPTSFGLFNAVFAYVVHTLSEDVSPEEAVDSADVKYLSSEDFARGFQSQM